MPREHRGFDPGATVDFRHLRRGGEARDPALQDLWVDPLVMAALSEFVFQVKHRGDVELLGTKDFVPVAIFGGDYSTGKTIAGRAVAHELGLDFRHVPLAAMLRRDATNLQTRLTELAEELPKKALLVFVDQMEVAFNNPQLFGAILGLMDIVTESKQGAVIVAANRVSFDETTQLAFASRVRPSQAVYFGAPNAELAARVWEGTAGAFVSSTLELAPDLDYATLASETSDWTHGAIFEAVRLAVLRLRMSTESLAAKMVLTQQALAEVIRTSKDRDSAWRGVNPMGFSVRK